MKKPTAYKCTKCGRVTTYARLRCLSCRNERFERVTPAETATLVTATEVHMLPVGFDVRFLRVGIAEFPDGSRVTGWLVSERIPPGTRVDVRWEPIRERDGEKTYGFTFHPSG